MDKNEIINKLLSDGFYLGGSRKMNEMYPDIISITDNTDYDFYATYSPEVCDYLMNLGFMKTKTSDKYFDDECVDIYKIPELKLDVVLRHDKEFYRCVFESLNPEYYKRYLWKSNKERYTLPEDINWHFDQFFRTARTSYNMLHLKHTKANNITNDVNL